MNISDFGVAFIKGYEKLRLVAYMPTPDDKPTIGYGHTKGVQMGDTCTAEQAEAFLREDLADAETCVRKRTNGCILTQGQYDAMVSLCYRIGCPQFTTSSVLRLTLDGDDDGAANSFILWNKQRDKATGALKVVNGLTNRANAEADIFRSTT